VWRRKGLCMDPMHCWGGKGTPVPGIGRLQEPEVMRVDEPGFDSPLLRGIPRGHPRLELAHQGLLSGHYLAPPESASPGHRIIRPEELSEKPH